jgi:hypothetical protein
MSATDSQNVNVDVVAGLDATATAKKPRAKTLPAKYSKFIQFGYYFVQKISVSNVEHDHQNALWNLLHLFDSIEDQQAFVQEFFDNSKEINKEIRKLVTAHKKNASKPPKAPKTNQRRKKTQVVTDVQDELVNELVLLAHTEHEPATTTVPAKKTTAKNNKKKPVEVVHNNTPVLSESENSPQTVPEPQPVQDPIPAPAKKARKTPAKKDAVVDTAEPTPATIPVDTKPKKTNKKNKDAVVPPTPVTVTENEHLATKPKKNNKKNKDVVITPTPTPAPAPASIEDDDEPLAVSIIIINDVKYFIDDDFCLYHHETQEPVGTFIDKQLALY